MVDVNTQNKTISVNVSSSGVSSNVNASGDTTLYYSNKAKEWATSNRIVDGVDYSSKYYAGKANQSALNAQSFAQSAQDSYNNFQDSVTDSLNTIDNKVQEATENIEIQKQDVTTEIQDIATNQKEDIENLSEQEQNKIIDLGIDTRANVDLSNLTQEGEKHFLNKSQITNCITEIPQRIKYTLEDGTLTIKAGSVVIVPYGVEDLTSQYSKGVTFINDNFKVYDTQFEDGKFFVWAEIQNDKTLSLLNRDTVDFVFYTFSDDRLAFSTYSNSGDAQPSAVTLWYNTLNNNVNKTSTTAIELTGCTLPLMIVNNKTDITQGNVSQVFNGMGYIGSTVWVDKGVKGLIPNGRNEDGTLKNIEYTSDKILMRTFDSAVIGDINIQLTPDGTLSYSYGYTEQNFTPSKPVNGCLWFNVARNTMRRWISTTTDWSNAQNLITMVIGWGTVESGKITRFNPKITFKAIDFSDRPEVSGWGMPSDRYIDLTLGASGSSYTAPANGWVYFNKDNGNAGNWIMLLHNDCLLYDTTVNTGNATSVILPIKKGDTFYAHYILNNHSNVRFRFYYAQGSESEV